MLVKNPVIEEGLTIVKREKKLHKFVGVLLACLTILIFYTGPKNIIQFVQSSYVPLFHLFLWFGIIIGFIGINLYWTGERDILSGYSSISKWFSYTDVTPMQFCTGKIVLCCIESFVFIMLMTPLIIISMIVAGFAYPVIILVLSLIFVNIFTCRLITVYFQSTFTGKKFPFSLASLFMYFWIILFYIGTFFIFPYANIFSVLLTLEPATAFLFESLVHVSLIPIPLFSLLTKAPAPIVPVWIMSLSIHLILIFVFIFVFSMTLILMKKHNSTRAAGKGIA